jgi:hypothetical protein
MMEILATGRGTVVLNARRALRAALRRKREADIVKVLMSYWSRESSLVACVLVKAAGDGKEGRLAGAFATRSSLQ